MQEMYGLTDAKFSDIDKKVYPTDECYKINIKNYAAKTFIDFDVHKDQMKQNLPYDMLQLALQNGCKWMSWKQIDGKLTKVEAIGVGNIEQSNID